MGPRRRWAAASLYLFCLPAVSVAQHYTFETYVNGLGNLTANCMLQDRSGFLWIGTESGLYRYDGARFVGFGRPDGLPASFVRALHEDSAGRLWVGAPDRFASVTYQGRDLQIGYSSTLSSSPDGHVYAVTQLGLMVLSSPDNGRSWRVAHLDVPENALNTPVVSVLAGNDESLLFGCGQGVCGLRAGKLASWGPGEGLAPDSYQCLLRTSNGDLWVRGAKHVALLPAGQERFENRDLPTVPASSVYLTLAEDPMHRVLA